MTLLRITSISVIGYISVQQSDTKNVKYSSNANKDSLLYLFSDWLTNQKIFETIKRLKIEQKYFSLKKSQMLLVGSVQQME